MWNWLRRLIKPKYMGWDSYKAKVDFVDMFYWQQDVRKENLKNGSPI